MKKAKHKTFPESDSKEKVRNQSRVIKHLEKEIKRLKAELATLNAAFKKAAAYMSDESKILKVEELIKAAQDHMTLKEAKTEYVASKKEEAERSREEVRAKWADWAKKNRSTTGGDDEI